MFSGDVKCIYCGCKINFSGNVISYQNQRCANHNQEHQFPGMNIIVNDINNNLSYLRNLPLTTQRISSLKSFRYPEVLKRKKSTVGASTNLRNYTMKDFKRYNINNENSLQTTHPVLPTSDIGKLELQVKVTTFKLI